MASDLNVLVTCGRFHAATGLVRAFHAKGARVDVVDPYKLSASLHSNAVDRMHVVASAAIEPVQFAHDIAEIVRQRQIDLVVPAYEDGFYLARYAKLIDAPLFMPPFEIVRQLHDKAQFVGLCHNLDLRTPQTEVVMDRDGLRSAVNHFEEFVARPAFSRGGQVYLTNHGPRTDELSIDDCTPTDENPWLVQEYIDGHDACSFSIVRDGKVLVHCVYEPSIPAPGGFSVQFSTIEDFGSLEVVSRICGEFNYTGFIGFDYRRTQDGLVMIECNPRSSAGVFLVPKDWVGEVVLGSPNELRQVEPGIRRQYDGYLINRHIVRMPARRLVHELLTTPDVFMAADDMLPALYFFISLRHWSKLAKREHLEVGQAYLNDVSWDGTTMPDLPTPSDGSR